MKNFLVNTAANFFGRIYIALLAVVMVPVYISYLGVESYGLVGFYTTLLGTFTILDFGLSTTLNREIAKAKATNSSSTQLRNLVFTLETVYWILGAVIGLAVILLSGPIAHHWLNAENLSAATVKKSIFLMGVVIAFQWPLSLYHGGMMGMDKQVQYNAITVIMMTLRSVGVLLIFIFVSPTIEAFFVWQVVINILNAVWLYFVVWKHLTTVKTKKEFSVATLKQIWRFAAGLTSTGIVTFILTQSDKILLSKILSLEQFSYYMLAFTVAGSLSNFTNPVSTAVFPQFSSLVAGNKTTELKKIYHFASRLTATLIIPVSLTLVFFTPEVLTVWLKKPDVVLQTTSLVRVLVIGTMFNCVMMTPYMLTLAFGWTKLGFYQNLIAVIVLIPLLFWWTHMYGAIGATFVWLSINVCSVFISVPVIHTKIFNGETASWYIKDNLIPLLFAASITIIVWSVFKNWFNNFQFNYFSISIVFALICGISFLQFPGLKKISSKYLNGLSK